MKQKQALGKAVAQQRVAATTWTTENAGQSELEFHTIMMYKLLLIILLFHGLVKVQSARLDLRLAECLTSQTASI